MSNYGVNQVEWLFPEIECFIQESALSVASVRADNVRFKKIVKFEAARDGRRPTSYFINAFPANSDPRPTLTAVNMQIYLNLHNPQ